MNLSAIDKRLQMAREFRAYRARTCRRTCKAGRRRDRQEEAAEDRKQLEKDIADIQKEVALAGLSAAQRQLAVLEAA